VNKGVFVSAYMSADRMPRFLQFLIVARRHNTKIRMLCY